MTEASPPRLRLPTLSRRALLAALALASLPREANAFGQWGAFHPRRLRTAATPRESVDPRATALAHWSWEVIRRTSAPARLTPSEVAAGSGQLIEEPFAVWFGGERVAPLTLSEVRSLREFLLLGGMLLVDDSRPDEGEFGRSVRKELARVLPESPVLKVPATHVLYKSYFLLQDGPVGRVKGPPYLESIAQGRALRVIFSSHDLMGALAQGPAGDWALPMQSGGPRERELALRLAVNLAMYLLCLDYKDDQVHAQELMRRRGRLR